MISLDGAFGSDIVQMIIHAGLVVKCVLFLLLVFSVVSWAIIFMKWRLFRRAREESGYFLEMFWDNPAFHRLYNDTSDLKASPVAQLFRAAYAEIQRLGRIQNPSTTKNGAPMLSMMDVVDRTNKKNNDRSGQQAGEGHFLSCDDGQHDTVHRALWDRLGNHGGLPGHWNERGGQPGRGGAGNIRSPHCHGSRSRSSHSGGGGLQLLQQQADEFPG